MNRLLLPALLTAAAFGGGWWFGAQSSGAGTTSPSAATKFSATSAKPTLPRYGLARRANKLKKEGDISFADIRRILQQEGGILSYDVDPILATWGKSDPEGLWRRLESGGGNGTEFFILGRLFDQWIKTDPDAALKALLRCNIANWPHLGTRALEALFTTDEKTRAKLLVVFDQLVARGAYLMHHQDKALEDVNKLLSLPASKGRDALLRARAYDWVDEDWKGAAQWASTLTEPLKSQIMAKVATRAVDSSFMRDRTGPQNAESLAWMGDWLKSASRKDRQTFGSSYIRVLAAVDSAAALEWAQTNLQGAPLAGAVSEVLSSQSAKDPDKTRSMVEQLPPGGLKTKALFAVAGAPGIESAAWLFARVDAGAPEWTDFSARMASGKPDDFMKFAGSSSVDALPEKFLRTGTRILAGRDPSGTLAWASGLPTNNAASIALDEWSRNDAPSAVAWVKNHPDASFQASSIPSLADQYFRHAPGDAVDWVASLPPGPVRDESLTVLRKNLSSSSSIKSEVRTSLEAKLGSH